MNNIQKSPYDNRQYETFVLPNNLKVLLVSDKNTSENCVSMLINVGYIYDTYSGMAHFLEHMLFMGTHKYPDENYFSDFITKNGGYTNAFTSCNHTCYYYTIQENYLEQSLDIFSQFFIDPLLSKSAVEREISAVNAEHLKNKHDDGWRCHEIIKAACCSDHAYKKFGTGSNDTLKIDNIDKHVKSFYLNNYSSDEMTLIILGNDSLDVLKQHTIKYFSNVVMRNTLKQSPEGLRTTGQILKVPQIIHMNSIKSIEKLFIYWEIDIFDSPYTSPLDFVIYILNHESKNSLHYVLSHEGLITSLNVEMSEQVNDKTLLQITMTLAPFGKQNINLITHIIYYYINLLKKNIDNQQLYDLYKEFRKLKKINFIYTQKYDAQTTIMDFVDIISLYNVNLNDILSFTVKIKDYDYVKPNMCKLFSQLTNNNSVIVICSNSLNLNNPLHYSHYKIKYTIEPNYTLSSDYNCKIFDNMIDQLDIPSQNIYIPKDFKMINLNHDTPTKIINKNGINAYWKPVQTYKIPLVCVYSVIYIPNILKNATNNVKGILYLNSMINNINHELYLCSIAGYFIDIFILDNRLYLFIEGFSDNINKVCKFIIQSLLSKKIDDITFDSAQFHLKSMDNNAIYKNPYMKVGDVFLKKMMHNNYDYTDRLQVIDTITKQNTFDFVDELLTTTSLKIMIFGNIRKNDAINIVSDFSQFSSNYVYNPEVSELDLFKPLISSENHIIKVSENTHEENNAVAYYIELCKLQIGVTDNWKFKYCCIQIIECIIGDKYFDALRTKEEFGYIVNCSIKNLGDPQYITFYCKYLVQSPSKSTDEIIKRTELFIDEFKSVIDNITEQNFSKYIESCTTNLNNPFSNLSDETEYYFTQFEQNYELFDIDDILEKIYSTITKNDIVDFYNNMFIINRKSIACAYKKY